MNTTFQKQLQIGGWILIVTLALGAIWLWQSINRTSTAGNVSDTITVSGTGTVTAVPDIAVADIAISVEGTTAAKAQDEANVKSNSVVDYLKDAGIKEADIKTSGYNIYPQYNYRDGVSSIRGYQVTQSLTVKIREIDDANDILDGVVDAGANQVNSLRFSIDEPDELKAEARKKAIDDANDKADELKDQLGVRLGRIVGFSESGGDNVIMYARETAIGIGGGGAVPAPDLPTGENEVTVNVTITYQIK